MSSYHNNIAAIDKVCQSLENWIDKQTVHCFFKDLCDNYDLDAQKKNYTKNDWSTSTIRELLQTHERLLLTDKLYHEIGDDFEKRYWYPQLITYLRLTCFDKLGHARKQWMPFNDWIVSKKKKTERENIIATLVTEDKIAFAQKLFSSYQRLYSVKNSFYSFLRTTLPPTTRKDLTDHVKISVRNEHSPLETRLGSIAEKEDYLYKIRNDFTHNIYSAGPIKDFKKMQYGILGRIYTKEKRYCLCLRTSSSRKNLKKRF